MQQQTLIKTVNITRLPGLPYPLGIIFDTYEEFMARPIHKIDEIAKAILLGVEQYGKKKTFAQILDEANVEYDKDIEIEVANTLEALRLIESVSYKLPLEIRAELSSTGFTIVASLKKNHQGSSSMRPGGNARPGMHSLL